MFVQLFAHWSPTGHPLVTYGKSKTKEKFKLLAVKVAMHGRLQEAPNIVIWLAAELHVEEVIAYESWSQPEVWL